MKLPEALARVSPYAFAECTALCELTIPEGVREVSAFAFGGCSALTYCHLPDSAACHKSVFVDCAGLFVNMGTKTVPAGIYIACEESDVTYFFRHIDFTLSPPAHKKKLFEGILAAYLRGESIAEGMKKAFLSYLKNNYRRLMKEGTNVTPILLAEGLITQSEADSV